MRTVLAFAAACVGLILLVPILLIAAPLWIVSACTRGFARLFEPSYVTRDQLIEFDPHVGWKPRPNLDTHHLMVDLFRIRTDAQGWRGHSTVAESDIIVFGDSFAAGYGVSEKHLFANLGARPRIKPIGIGGYSMVQELLWMKALAPSLRGKFVVWFIYFGNDLYDNLSPELRGYRKPFVRERKETGGWEIVSSHVSRERWPIPARAMKGHVHMATLTELCSDTLLAERAYSACEFLMQEAKRICADAGAQLAVLTIPEVHQLTGDGQRVLQSLGPHLRDFDADQPDKKLASICRRLRLPVVHGRDFLDVDCYKTNDCHWTELGHRRVAAMLAELHASEKTQPAGLGAMPSGPAMVSRTAAVKSASM